MSASTPSGVTASLLLNSTLAEAAIVGLADSDLITLAITYIPGAANASLNIQSIVITVDDLACVSPLPPSIVVLTPEKRCIGPFLRICPPIPYRPQPHLSPIPPGPSPRRTPA
jgi:hypothetical protein